jgi:hypothetical protein
MHESISRALRARLTFANVVASLALFMALGGTSYAAITLTNNSVKSKHIANGQVKRTDIRNNAVNSAKIAAGSLTSSDFAAGQIPPGPTGPAGPTGPSGPKGDKGDPGASFSPSATLPSGQSLTGPWTVGGGNQDWLADAVQYRIPLAAPIASAKTHWLGDGQTSTDCPGYGQATAGHLCIYTNEFGTTDVPAFGAIYHNEGSVDASDSGSGRFGFNIFFKGDEAESYLSGTYTVTAP